MAGFLGGTGGIVSIRIDGIVSAGMGGVDYLRICKCLLRLIQRARLMHVAEREKEAGQLPKVRS